MPMTPPGRKCLLLLPLTLLLLAADSHAQTSDGAVAQEATGFDTALRRAARLPRLNSLLVSRGSETLVETYFNGASPSEPANIKSVSKSVISALVGIAIARGDIEGVGQRIGAYFGALEQDDARKAAITVEDLLTMRSGLETTSNRNYGAWVLSRNWVEFALRQPLEYTPGRYMEYSTGNTHLLSAILTAATGRTTLEFARDHLTEPLGFRLPEWPRDPQGVYFGGNDMEMTPRQMLAFGQLYMNEGRANGKQVIPSDWVQASLEPRAESRREADRWYGYGWWIRRMAGLQTPYAWGYGGQFIVLVPDLKIVVVTTSDSSPGAERRSQRRAILSLIEHDIVAPAAHRLRRGIGIGGAQ